MLHAWCELREQKNLWKSCTAKFSSKIPPFRDIIRFILIKVVIQL